jgi:hypothetical protein
MADIVKFAMSLSMPFRNWFGYCFIECVFVPVQEHEGADMKQVLGIALSLVVLAMFAPSAQAGEIVFFGDCNSGSCFGATYTLTISTSNGTDYTAELDIDVSGYVTDANAREYIEAVDFKVTSAAVSNLTLTAAPGGVVNWETLTGHKAGNGGCSDVGAGFNCAEQKDPLPLDNASLPHDGIYSWAWTFSTTGQITFDHLGAKYSNNVLENDVWSTTRGTITSLSKATTKVPEPQFVLLLAVSLLAVAVLSRRWGA